MNWGCVTVCCKFNKVILSYKTGIKCCENKSFLAIKIYTYIPTELNPSFKKYINYFCMHKTFPFFIWFIFLVNIIGIKLAPGDYESNFKKVGAIPCGCNKNWTTFIYELRKCFQIKLSVHYVLGFKLFWEIMLDLLFTKRKILFANTHTRLLK